MSGTFEKEYVHQVYNAIAPHFSQTRHSGWPRVEAFMRSVPSGNCVLDVGTGNGKYMRYGNAVRTKKRKDPCTGEMINVEGRFRREEDGQSRIAVIGLDASRGLLEIANDRGYEVVEGEAGQLGCLRSGVIDHCICIATLHHLSKRQARIDAVASMMQTVNKKGGRLLIVVWATDLDGDAAYSARRATKHVRQMEGGEDENDVLVPWTVHSGETYERYYHLYTETELKDTLRKAASSLGYEVCDCSCQFDATEAASNNDIESKESDQLVLHLAMIAYERDNWYGETVFNKRGQCLSAWATSRTK